VKNILIINLARLGDIIQTIPMIEGLNRKYPGCRVFMLVNSSFLNVCKIIPGLYKSVGIDFSLIHNHLFSSSSTVEEGYYVLKEVFDALRTNQFDKIINITPHDIGVISTYLSGEEKSFWSNVNDWSKYYFNITKNWDTLTLNVVDLFKRIAGVSRQQCYSTIKQDKEAVSFADNLLKKHGHINGQYLIGMQPGASTDDKKWPLKYFIDLSDKILNKLDAKVILFGGKDDISDGAAIESNLKDNIINLVGKTDMSQLCALMSRTNVLITNDTGPMHIAAFTGTKIISINMGKEICETTGPYGNGNISLQPKIDCYPCKKPILCSKQICKNAIKPKDVFTLVTYLCGHEKTDLSYCIKDDMGIYVSKFDQYGTIDFLPFFKVSLDLRTFYRKIVRIVWDLSLSEEFNDVSVFTAVSELEYVFEKYFITNDFYENVNDIKNMKSHLLGIAELSSNGLNISRQLLEYSTDVHKNIKVIGYLSQDLEVTEKNIYKAGEGLSELNIIISMFKFEVDNLKGQNMSEMAEETGLIYYHFKNRLNLTVKIIDYYMELKSKTYNNQQIA